MASWWRHQMETLSALLALCVGNSPVPGDSPHKGQWRGALMFSLICARINGWINNREASDLRRHRAHYDVIVMIFTWHCHCWYTYWHQVYCRRKITVNIDVKIIIGNWYCFILGALKSYHNRACHRLAAMQYYYIIHYYYHFALS